MPNRKFDNLDRQKTLGDQKYRIIDMIENPFVVPDVAWDAEPVRYFKLNLQWCKILAGWLEWMEDVAGWQDADDELHAGIQGFLFFERGIEGGIFMTPDEFRDALDAGMYSAFNKLARQIVSGRYTDIAVDEDGNVSQPSESGGDAGLPEDDPGTPTFDEAFAAKAGGCRAVVSGFNSIWSDMANWQGIGLSEATMQARLMQKYQIVDEESAYGFVHAYTTAWPAHIASYTETLSSMLFCGGDNFKSTVADYIIENVDITLQGVGFALNNALTSEQISDWFNYGVEVPASDYKTYPCVPIPTETFTLNMALSNTPSYTTNGIWKANHRYQVKIAGTFTDSDNPNLVGDGMYIHDTSTGVKTWLPTNFNFTNLENIQQAKVPFEPSHIYIFTLDKGNSNNAGIIGRDNGAMALPNTTGILTYEITDLGEYAV